MRKFYSTLLQLLLNLLATFAQYGGKIYSIDWLFLLDDVVIFTQ